MMVGADERIALARLMNRDTFHGIDGFLRWTAECNEAWEWFELKALRVEALYNDIEVAFAPAREREGLEGARP